MSAETNVATATSAATPPPTATLAAIAGKSPLQIAWGRLRRDRVAMICALVVLFYVLVALFAPLITAAFGVSLEKVSVSERINPTNGLPIKGPPLAGFDPEHPLGVAPRTGDDNLAYWVYGCRTSLLIATVATVIAQVVGITVGLIGGFAGGWVDRIFSFLTDFFLTLPFLLVALSFAPIINERFSLLPNYSSIQKFAITAVLAGFGWMGIARLVRGEVLSLREREFIQSARVIGMPTHRILLKELLPNLVAPIVISTSLLLPAFVATEAGLALLGIGVTDGISWGQMLVKGTRTFDKYAFYLFLPFFGVVSLVVALNLLGDSIRDALDPKTRR